MAVHYLYVGSWLDESGNDGGGIRTYKVQEDGSLKLLQHTASNIAAGYMALSADNNCLYAVNEIKRRPDLVHTEGSIYAYQINRENGALQEINHVSSCGVFPNYAVSAPDGKKLYLVNYGSEDMVIRSRRTEQGTWILDEVYEESSMAALDIEKNGGLSPVRGLYAFSGIPSGYFEWFQAAPHPHCIGLDPSGKMLLVADRGCDRILTCHYNSEEQIFCDLHWYQTKRGIGPRNCIFHPELPYVYIAGEVKPYVTVYQYDAVTAELTVLDSYLTTGAQMEYRREGDFFAFAHPSDIKIHPNGKMLYVANRGPDTIACYEISDKDGRLKHIQNVSSEGRQPWSMDITRDGRYLYIGNKMSGYISLFALDDQGIPRYTGKKYQAERTVCLKCAEI